jgi:hypothetical protein
MWSLSIHGHGVEVTREIVAGTQRLLTSALGPLGARVTAVNVRLHRFGDPEATASCHIRVDLLRGDGFALGDSASEVATAISRAAERLRAVPMRMFDLSSSQQAAPAHAFLP